MMVARGIARLLVNNATSDDRGTIPKGGLSLADAAARLRFIRQLSVKLKAGLSVEKCLAALGGETRNRRLQKAVRAMHKEVAQRKLLAHAMRAQSAWFDACLVFLVERGELAGKLRAALANVADYLEHRIQLRKSVRGAVAQPLNALSLLLLATFVAAVALSFLVKEVMPVAGQLSPETISFLDRVALAVSRALRKAWPYVGVFGLVCDLALKLVPRISVTRRWSDHVALRLPLIGSLVRSAGLAQFYRTMGVAMQSGANMAIAMQFAAMTASNAGMRGRIAATYTKIQKNRPYIDALVEDGHLRLGDVKAVQAGERRGDIGAVMLSIAADREREALAEARSLKALSHTLVVIVLGLTILGVVFTLYVPVFVTR